MPADPTTGTRRRPRRSKREEESLSSFVRSRRDVPGETTHIPSFLEETARTSREASRPAREREQRKQEAIDRYTARKLFAPFDVTPGQHIHPWEEPVVPKGAPKLPDPLAPKHPRVPPKDVIKRIEKKPRDVAMDDLLRVAPFSLKAQQEIWRRTDPYRREQAKRPAERRKIPWEERVIGAPLAAGFGGVGGFLHLPDPVIGDLKELASSGPTGALAAGKSISYDARRALGAIPYLPGGVTSLLATAIPSPIPGLGTVAAGASAASQAAEKLGANPKPEGMPTRFGSYTAGLGEASARGFLHDVQRFSIGADGKSPGQNWREDPIFGLLTASAFAAPATRAASIATLTRTIRAANPGMTLKEAAVLARHESYKPTYVETQAIRQQIEREHLETRVEQAHAEPVERPDPTEAQLDFPQDAAVRQGLKDESLQQLNTEVEEAGGRIVPPSEDAPATIEWLTPALSHEGGIPRRMLTMSARDAEGRYPGGGSHDVPGRVLFQTPTGRFFQRKYDDWSSGGGFRIPWTEKRWFSESNRAAKMYDRDLSRRFERHRLELKQMFDPVPRFVGGRTGVLGRLSERWRGKVQDADSKMAVLSMALQGPMKGDAIETIRAFIEDLQSVLDQGGLQTPSKQRAKIAKTLSHLRADLGRMGQGVKREGIWAEWANVLQTHGYDPAEIDTALHMAEVQAHVWAANAPEGTVRHPQDWMSSDEAMGIRAVMGEEPAGGFGENALFQTAGTNRRLMEQLGEKQVKPDPAVGDLLYDTIDYSDFPYVVEEVNPDGSLSVRDTQSGVEETIRPEDMGRMSHLSMQVGQKISHRYYDDVEGAITESDGEGAMFDIDPGDYQVTVKSDRDGSFYTFKAKDALPHPESDTSLGDFPTVFYSQLGRELTADFTKKAKPGGAKPDEVLAWASNLPVKKDEIVWTGLPEWLDRMKQADRLVTAQDLQDFFNSEHELQVQEHLFAGGASRTYNRTNGTLWGTRWGRMGLITRPGDPAYKELVLALGGPTRFTHSHWDGIPNPVAHVRFTEIYDDNGQRVAILVHEFQSDWVTSMRIAADEATIDQLIAEGHTWLQTDPDTGRLVELPWALKRMKEGLADGSLKVKDRNALERRYAARVRKRGVTERQADEQANRLSRQAVEAKRKAGARSREMLGLPQASLRVEPSRDYPRGWYDPEDWPATALLERLMGAAYDQVKDVAEKRHGENWRDSGPMQEANEEVMAELRSSPEFQKIEQLARIEGKEKARIELLENEVWHLRMSTEEAPFQKTWREMMIRRITAYAAREGFGRVEWEDGIVQAIRYHHVDPSKELRGFYDNDYYERTKVGGYVTDDKPSADNFVMNENGDWVPDPNRAAKGAPKQPDASDYSYKFARSSEQFTDPLGGEIEGWGAIQEAWRRAGQDEKRLRSEFVKLRDEGLLDVDYDPVRVFEADEPMEPMASSVKLFDGVQPGEYEAGDLVEVVAGGGGSAMGRTGTVVGTDEHGLWVDLKMHDGSIHRFRNFHLRYTQPYEDRLTAGDLVVPQGGVLKGQLAQVVQGGSRVRLRPTGITSLNVTGKGEHPNSDFGEIVAEWNGAEGPITDAGYHGDVTEPMLTGRATDDRSVDRGMLESLYPQPWTDNMNYRSRGATTVEVDEDAFAQATSDWQTAMQEWNQSQPPRIEPADIRKIKTKTLEDGTKIPVSESSGLVPLYNKLIPGEAESLFKKHGVKVTEGSQRGTLMRESSPWMSAEGAVPTLGYDIPESLRVEATNGMRLMQRHKGEVKGAVEFVAGTPEGRRLIYHLERGDISTFFHELIGHAPAYFKREFPEEFGAIERKVGRNLEDWTTKDHERFARWVERYHRMGEAPFPEFHPVFDAIKRWMEMVYDVVTGIIGTRFPGEMRTLMDRSFGKRVRDLTESEKRAMAEVVDRGDPDEIAEFEAQLAKDRVESTLDPEVQHKLAEIGRLMVLDKKLIERESTKLSYQPDESSLAGWRNMMQELRDLDERYGGEDAVTPDEAKEIEERYKDLKDRRLLAEGQGLPAENERMIQQQINWLKEGVKAAENDPQAFNEAVGALATVSKMSEDYLLSALLENASPEQAQAIRVSFDHRRNGPLEYLREQGLLPYGEGEALGYFPHTSVFDTIFDRAMQGRVRRAAGATQVIAGKPALKRSAMQRGPWRGVLWHSGQLQLNPQIVLKVAMARLRLVETLDSRKLLATIGAPVKYEEWQTGPQEGQAKPLKVPKGWYVINTGAGYIPHRVHRMLAATNDEWESLVASGEDFEQGLGTRKGMDDAIEEAVDSFAWKADGGPLPEDGSWDEAWQAGKLRVVPPNIVKRILPQPFQFKPGGPFATALEVFNTSVRLATILQYPVGYIASNVPANLYMLALTSPTKGLKYALRDVGGARGMARGTRAQKQRYERIAGEAGDIMAEAGLPEHYVAAQSTAEQASRRAVGGTRWYAEKLGEVADTPYRVASWLGWADRYGFKTDKEIDLLLNDKRFEDVRNDISQRTRDDMIDFNALSTHEKEVVAKYFFLWPLIRGMARWPLTFAMNHPIASAALAQFGEEDMQRKYGYAKYGLGADRAMRHLGLIPIGDKAIDIGSINPVGGLQNVAEVGSIIQNAMTLDPTALKKFAQLYANPIYRPMFSDYTDKIDYWGSAVPGIKYLTSSLGDKRGSKIWTGRDSWYDYVLQRSGVRFRPEELDRKLVREAGEQEIRESKGLTVSEEEYQREMKILEDEDAEAGKFPALFERLQKEGYSFDGAAIKEIQQHVEGYWAYRRGWNDQVTIEDKVKHLNDVMREYWPEYNEQLKDRPANGKIYIENIQSIVNRTHANVVRAAREVGMLPDAE